MISKPGIILLLAASSHAAEQWRPRRGNVNLEARPEEEDRRRGHVKGHGIEAGSRKHQQDLKLLYQEGMTSGGRIALLALHERCFASIEGLSHPSARTPHHSVRK